MSRKTVEMQSLINESRKKLAEAENKIVERDYFIHKQEEKHRAGKVLIEKITQLVYSNNYNRPDVYLGKIKELVHDYQSKN